MSTGGDLDTSVKVAVRVRPQNAREQIDMCRMCTFCTPDQPQIILGKDKAFTYDYVFDTATEQHYLYDTCVEELVSGCFEGFNATVLAYGQTGSGKTYTMGTGFDMALDNDAVGVIPRAVNQIFTGMEERRREALERNEPPPQYELTAEFLELYNEEIIDLFDPDRDQPKKLRVHEDAAGNIYVAGATGIKVESENETLDCLKRGALSRTVGSTNMNAQSSRSHAIFSLHLTQQRPCKAYSSGEGQDGDSSNDPPSSSGSSEIVDWEQLSAKFHFVDLAGSERLKRTGATGDRAKEGISINCGLLALGNVISALGDKAKRGSHVPYRDSKLTRLLQDSLGGNSRTLMIACISPTDRDFMETLNTLKYANRARNIKNKVTVNQDKTSQQLAMMRSKIQELELELQEFKSGRMVVSEDGSVVVNDMANEITMLRTENDKLRMRIKAMQQVVESQSTRIAALAAEKEMAALGHQDESTGQVVGQAGSSDSGGEQKFANVIQGYIKEIEELKSRLVMSESLARQNPQSPFRRAPSMVRQQSRAGRTESVSSGAFEQQTDDLLQLARTNIQKLKVKEEKKVVHDSESHAGGRHDKRLQKHHSKESLLESSENFDSKPSGDKLNRQATSSSFGSDDESSNEDQESDDEELSDELTTTVDLSEDSDSDDSDTESLASSVAELSSEINLKQQLVDQLEKAQNNLYTMKVQYEEKVHILQTQIKSIESERDKVLKEIASRRDAGRNEEKTKAIKAKFEKQLSELKTELKTLKSARKEHAKAMKKNAQHERELKQLKSELLEMKKQKVKMLNKMRTEANQRKVDHARMDKEVAQLRKVSRKKDNQIKSLQSDARRREMVLKRRQEELAALRRQNRHLPGSAKAGANKSVTSPTVQPVMPTLAAAPSALLSVLSSATTNSGSGYSATVVFRQQPTAGGSTGSAFDRNSNKRKSSVFSSDSARKKWRDLERKIHDSIMKRLAMSTLAKDMDSWIEKRDELSRKIDDLRKQKETIMKAKLLDASELASVDEDLDSVSAHIEYVQENIVELQNDLIALDDSKSDGDTMEAHVIITSSSPRESKYLLEHLLDIVLDLGVKAGQRDTEVKSLTARLKASEQSAEIMKSFSSPQVSYPIVKSRTFTKSDRVQSSTSVQLFKTSRSHQSGQDPTNQPDIDDTARKLRRRTALPTELAPATLSSSATAAATGAGDGSSVSKGVHLFREKAKQLSDRPTSFPASVTVEDLESADGDTSSGERSRTGSEEPVPLTRRSQGSGKKKSSSSLEVSSSSSMGSSCPGSPSIPQRGMKHSGSESNVWSRLANSSHDISGDKGKGAMLTERESRRMSARLLTCTHTATGHTAGVLCVYATQNYLFSSSQDRTVKVWNLKTGTDLLTLDKHFSYVRCVRYCPRNSLIFTASQSHIKIWDMRHHRARCIKTFGPAPGSGPSSSETVVHDLLVSPGGNSLFSASGNFVNVWDLRKFGYCGRLAGHNGGVCALASTDDTMVTGSRDRLIKLFDLSSVTVDAASPVTHSSVCTLYPPHYDAVTSFGIYKDLLFSSCGVTFKQWDIKERCLKHAVDGAHSQGNNINSLATLSSPIMPMLVSGCKGGLLKLWNPENCANIGEVAAHKSSINSIATNDTCIFSGSSDKTIRIWRPSPLQDN